MKNLPTTIWVAAATAAVTCFSPVVGQVVTSPAVTVSPPPKSASPSIPSPVEVSTPTPTPAVGDVAAATTALGPTAVDREGRTLYLSVLDSNDPPRSVCLSSKCLTAWEPLYAPAGQAKPAAGPGVDSARLGVVRRADGRRQVTLGGWPLYRFDGDTSPGDVGGDGLKGTWRAIGPDGRPVR
ncbi:hypothetical protein [Kribbella sp. NPDC051770]|uniref:COG4315 family predicted lipoprotein n=1 Tax=Kribbella sp. NPDC051770 TaxID=3155413 RepID=UPI003429BD99